MTASSPHDLLLHTHAEVCVPSLKALRAHGLGHSEWSCSACRLAGGGAHAVQSGVQTTKHGGGRGQPAGHWFMDAPCCFDLRLLPWARVAGERAAM